MVPSCPCRCAPDCSRRDPYLVSPLPSVLSRKPGFFRVIRNGVCRLHVLEPLQSQSWGGQAPSPCASGLKGRSSRGPNTRGKGCGRTLATFFFSFAEGTYCHLVVVSLMDPLPGSLVPDHRSWRRTVTKGTLFSHLL